MTQGLKGLLQILLVIVLIVYGPQWLLLQYTPWSIALLTSAMIACVVAFLYVTLRQATPNGGSNGPKSLAFITPFLVVFTGLLGSLALISYQIHKPLPKTAFLLPLTLIIVFAMVRYVYSLIKTTTLYQQLFSYCKIELANRQEMGDYFINEITFHSTSNGLVTCISPLSKQMPHPSIPRFADKIVFRFYSDNASRSFSNTFPFNYSLCQEQEGRRMGWCFWLRQKKILPLKVVLGPQNTISLYLEANLLSLYELKEGQ